MTTIGIDFGTTNSVVAQWTPSGSDILQLSSGTVDMEWERYGYGPVMPSVYAVGDAGQPLFGFQALEHDGPRFDAVKRLFAVHEDTAFDSDGSALMVEEVATLLFAELLRRSRELEGVDPKRAVVTVPANSRGLARHRTKICAGMAGVQVLALINEPTAAALAYGANHSGDQTVLVFDWGGGTLDVTVLRAIDGVFIEETSSGLPRRGGIDFDTRMRKLVLDTIPDAERWSARERHVFNRNLELAKIQLSNLDEVEVRLPNKGVHRITRAAFNSATRTLVEDARRPIERCLNDLGLGSGAIDALVMVGGTSNIPAVRALVAEVVGREPEAGINPMTAVAEGAAVAAAILGGEAGDRYELLVSLEHALGTDVLNPQTLEQNFDVIIPRGASIPCERTKTFVPVFEGQEEVKIEVLEGDPQRPIDDPDNVLLKEFVVVLDPDAEDPSFELGYAYDFDGILTVTVTLSDGTQTTEAIGFGPGTDRQAMVDLSRRVRTVIEDGDTSHLDAASTDDPLTAQLVQKVLVNVIPFLDEDEAEPLHALLAEVREAEPGHRSDAVSALEDALVPYSYLM